ncbi:MAG TPA: ATP-binding cassette domain-containing protein [Ilumatobacteraceae bacterium]|nr:ATP-binding cassette domain-containing protein [Ilumatobacteraceae bacterium]
MSAVLRAEGLRKWFRSGDERITPVDGVDLEIGAGEIVLITGPSGSGKTTLLQMLTGFQQPDEGQVSWPGGGEMPGWQSVAVVPQSLGLLPELTASENVALPLLAGGAARPAQVAPRVSAALQLVGVDHLADRLVGETSLGQQQRVAVARALICGPAVIIADEPTSHQDSGHAEVVLRAIAAVVSRGAACVLAGHDPLLLRVATRVVHLERGRLA